MNIIELLKERYLLRKDPVRYWRKKGARIGSGSEIYSSANFGSEPYLIEVGDNVRINSGVQLITHDGGLWVVRHLHENMKDVDLFGRIKIGNNVHIGTNAIIMPGVVIGSNCIIGCGAVVTHDVLDNTIVGGVPARKIETIDEYITKNKCFYEHTKNMTRDDKKKYLLSKIK